MASRAAQPTFLDLFTPKLATVLKEGYGLRDLRADAVAGLTVAVVALPLSIAIAIASGVSPDRGIYTSIIGGFIVSMLGGSRFQIGGPAGAFIILVAATVAQHGLDGLLIATMLSGLILVAVGLLRLGTFIRYIPYPVTVGFTAGIAVIILASQIKDLLGLTLENEPGPLVPKLQALATVLPDTNAFAVGVAIATIIGIMLMRRYRPQWPAFIIAVGASALIVKLTGLPVETIGTRFGGIPQGLPTPQLPAISFVKAVEVLPAAFSFALLGCIESLLSAVVADSMTGRRHRSNCELVAQGVANIATPLFGGFCVTGNIARTAINVRSGARGPVAGMLHSLFLLAFMLVAAPVASYIPLAALAGVLAVVAWNMAERHQFATLVRTTKGDAATLLVTFILVVFHDLVLGILAGFFVGALLFLHRMAESIEVQQTRPLLQEDKPDTANGEGREAYDSEMATHKDVVVYRISGAFFFGAAASVADALERIGERPKAYVIDFRDVPMLDSTGAVTIEGFARKAARQGAAIHISGTSQMTRHMLLSHGVEPPLATFHKDLADAVAAAHAGAAASDALGEELPEGN